MSEFVQVVLTDDHAVQTASAIALALENSTEEQLGGPEGEQVLKSLAVFFGGVAAEPERFPVTGRMASKVKRLKRQARGPAQPQSRRNRRKLRQERRQGGAKRRRQERAENVANFNQAMESLARDREEMEAAHQEQQAHLQTLLEAETLTVDEYRELLSLAYAPPAMLEALSKLDVKETPKLILPASAE